MGLWVGESASLDPSVRLAGIGWLDSARLLPPNLQHGYSNEHCRALTRRKGAFLGLEAVQSRRRGMATRSACGCDSASLLTRQA